MTAFQKTSELPAEVASLRQALFLATGGGITIAGTWLLTGLFRSGGITATEWALLVLFVILFGQLAFGFSIAFWGFVVWLRGGEPYEVMRTLPETEDCPPGSTAIIMPVFNEEPGRIFRAVENMVRSLEATGCGAAFDFFILSDSNNPDNWIEEECAWVNLCSRLNAFGRIFYRKRRVSLHGKSGNVADFCRRWGQRYRYAVVLDADSVMTGELLVRLARVMDANPAIGIVQTAPQIVRGTSLLQRLVQFSTRSVGPLFAAGSNFWHLAGASYWGHNAIIRLQPFMQHCVLPELPGRSAADRHILSHDTVEAALMQQAGFQVWFAYQEPGSYEEGPPNLSESFKRDRRWCQGNLQHFWFLFAPGTHFTNRIHIFFGLMAYLSAPLLLVFITLSGIDTYWKQQFAILSARAADPVWTGTWWTSVLLLGLTVTLLFLPKVLGAIHLLPRAREFGGVLRMGVSVIFETLLSILLAPIFLFFYTQFVVLTLLGLRVNWKTQNRTTSAIPFGEAIRTYGPPTLLGIAVTVLTLMHVPILTLWLSPLLAGWLLAIPLALLTSSDRVGGWLRSRGLLLIPEEIRTPPILAGLDDPPPALARPQTLADVAHYGILRVVLDPFVNAVHIALLRRSRVHAKHKGEYLAALSDRLLSSGPGALTVRETHALLWDSGELARVHRDLWTRPGTRLDPWWRFALRHASED